MEMYNCRLVYAVLGLVERATGKDRINVYIHLSFSKWTLMSIRKCKDVFHDSRMMLVALLVVVVVLIKMTCPFPAGEPLVHIWQYKHDMYLPDHKHDLHLTDQKKDMHLSDQ